MDYTLRRFIYPDAPVSTSTRKIELKRANKLVKENTPPLATPSAEASVVDAVPELEIKPLSHPAKSLKTPSLEEDDFSYVSFPSDTRSRDASIVPEIKPLTAQEAFPAGSEVSFQVLSIKASKLRSVEMLGKNDPYVTLSLKKPASWSGKTTVLDGGGSDVEWNNLDKDASLRFHLSQSDLTSSVLDVQASDSNSFRSDVLIGAAEVKLSEGTYEHIHHLVGLLYVTASLKEKGGKNAGTVAVSFKLTKREKL